jgi:uracil-DNA glycosylase
VLGPKLSITAAREERLIHEPTGIEVVATIHPSAILRAPQAAGRDALRSQLLEDLRRALQLAGADHGR